jgi:hypothetical protein
VFDESVVINNPSQVANTEEEYIVEAIIGEKEENGIKKYLVKWLDYDEESDNTWEPFDHVADTLALEKWIQREHDASTCFVETVNIDEPTTYNQALSGPNTV